MESYDDDLKNFAAHGAAPLPVTRREPFRTAAKAGAIQQRDACFPRQGSFLKEDDARRRLACSHWINRVDFCRLYDMSV